VTQTVAFNIAIGKPKSGSVEDRTCRVANPFVRRTARLPLVHAPLTSAVRRSELELFDAVATAPKNRVAFFLERGEMIVINNYTVMQARTSFKNHPEPESKRHLLRLWMDRPGFVTSLRNT
jgi:alpha-ketoglutarate-dependent taurine dioxygenase